MLSGALAARGWSTNHKSGANQTQIRRKSSETKQNPHKFKIGMAKKAKARTIIVRLYSAAQTGFYYTMQRRRVLPKLALRKYDPISKSSRSWWLTTKFANTWNSRRAKSRRLVHICYIHQCNKSPSFSPNRLGFTGATTSSGPGGGCQNSGVFFLMKSLSSTVI